MIDIDGSSAVSYLYILELLFILVKFVMNKKLTSPFSGDISQSC
jgi:hypothetical protein